MGLIGSLEAGRRRQNAAPSGSTGQRRGDAEGSAAPGSTRASLPFGQGEGSSAGVHANKTEALRLEPFDRRAVARGVRRMASRNKSLR